MWERLIGSLLTLGLASRISFLAVEVAPGDRVELLVGAPSREKSQEALARIRQRHGLERPAAIRYLGWLCATLRGNLGVSVRTNRPIGEEVKLQKFCKNTNGS